MRVLTRGDMDGMTSIVLLSQVEDISEISFTHPKDVQDGKVKVTAGDIIINLPYIKGCGMWFDHHVSEEIKLKDIGQFKGSFAVAPSTARVISDYYKSAKFDKFRDLLEATDRLDSGKLTQEEVTSPSGWILLGLTLDPRSGLAMEFRDYFRWLLKYVTEMPVQKVLEHPEVKKRTLRVLREQEEFKKLLKEHSRQDGNVIISDLRGVKGMPAGNRFLIYTMYPSANIEVRVFPGILDNTVVAVGHSIFNRTSKVNVGKLLSGYGGGGHPGAGTCQLRNDEFDIKFAEILKKLKEG